MIDEELVDIEIQLDDDLQQKIVDHLGTYDPQVIQQWIQEVLNTVFSEYLDKEKGE